MTHILLKDNDITENTIMGGNIDKSRYVNDVKSAQNLFIKKFLGKKLYKKIVTDYINDNLSGEYQELYEDYVKEMLIHSSTELYLAHGAYMVTNVGITKHRTDSSETVNKEEVDFLIESSRKLFHLYRDEALEFLNNSSIVEWGKSCDKHNSLTGGWYIK